MIINKYEILQNFWSIALTTLDFSVRIRNRDKRITFFKLAIQTRGEENEFKRKITSFRVISRSPYDRVNDDIFAGRNSTLLDN